MSRFDSGYEDLDRSLGFGGIVVFGLTVALLAVFALLAMTFDDNRATTSLRTVERARMVATPPLRPVLPPADAPRLVAYIVDSEAAARELKAGLAHFDLPGISILVAETPEQADVWKASLKMAAWEGVSVEFHDLTAE